jgi:Concanavalin A-like lectin/glucanases superfamily
MSDPYAADVTLELWGGGSNGSTTYIDSSPVGHTLTGNSSVSITTADSRYGGSSIVNTVQSTGAIEIPFSTSLSMGTGDFTLESWIKVTTFTTGLEGIFGNAPSGGGGALGHMKVAMSASQFLFGIGPSTSIIATVTNTVGVWDHWAVCRVAGTIFIYKNGVQVGTGAGAASLSYTGAFRLFASLQGSGIEYHLRAYIDNFRLTKGVARYTATFTPPVQFEPIPFATVAISPPPPALNAYFGIASSTSAPAPSLVGYSGANVSIFPASPTLNGFGGSTAAFTAPAPTFFAAAHNSAGENDFTYTAPRATLSAFGGVTAKLKPPGPTLSITATVMNLGRATLVAPAATLDVTSTVSGIAYANLTFGLSGGGSYDLIGYGGAVCSVTLTGSPTVQATGTSGSIGGAQITAPLFELTALGTAQSYGGANLLAPSPELGRTIQAWLVAPGAQLTAIGTAVVVATYGAYTVNLKHMPRGPGQEAAVDEVTHYTNFPFTHVVRYRDSYYGANSTGLYLLEGTTDDAASIPFAVKTGTTDFGSPEKKTVSSAHFSGRFGPASTIGIQSGEGTANSYSFSTPRDALAQNHRQVFGKGVKEKYHALSVSGTSVFELDSIELDTRKTTRRI